MDKLKPKLRFQEFVDDYEHIKFKDIISSSGYGPRFNGDDYDINGNVKTIRGTDIDLNGEIKYYQVPTASLDENFIKNHILKDGDLVMITTADCGLTGVYKKQDINYIPSAYAVKITLNEKANPYFYKYFFQTRIATNQINRFVRKATVANLPGSDILKIEIKLPNIIEQDKIANFLSVVDNKINQLLKKKELLEKYKKGIMQKIFSQEIRFKDNKDNEYPKWTEAKLSDFKNLIHGDGDWILSNDLSKEGKHKLIQLGNIGYGVYKEKDLKTISAEKFIELKGTPIKKGDLLINRMVDSNLYCCILDKDGDYITSVDVCWIRDNNMLNNYFLMSVLLFEKNQNKLLSLSSGSGRVRISKSNLFNEFHFLLPSFEEQNKIGCFIAAIDNNINHVVIQLDKTNTFKKGLLQQMFV
jgi:type I restriction enzyme S subunit